MNYIEDETIINNFITLTGFDSEAFYEHDIAEYVKEKLEKLGLMVRIDTTDEEYLKAHPQSFPNIYGFLPGNIEGEPLLFSAHLDTVAPGKEKKRNITSDGRITSDGSTVLGADDISGVVSIFYGLEQIRKNDLAHPDIEVLFTVAEEMFCEGSRYLDYSLIKSKRAYVFDLSGNVGSAAVRAPSIFSFEIDIKGRASHAGFAPQKGINALNIAVDSLKGIRTGKTDEETTVNFGTINGGTGKNIVPEKITITGEVRSLDHEKAKKTMEGIIETFSHNARKAGGVAYCYCHEHIRAFTVDRNKETVKHFMQALPACDMNEIDLITTFGGSDANRLNEHGIETIVLACGMENVHTTKEYIAIKELKKSAELALRLMTHII